jgi:hypothetical protein
MPRYAKILVMIATGGALLQTATSCESTILPLVANIAISILLQSISGGIAT